MAIYNELPIYKASYDLLLEIFRFTKNMGMKKIILILLGLTLGFADTGEGVSDIVSLDTVDPTVQVLAPNGGEIYVNEEFIDITWSASDFSFGDAPIKIYFSEDGGETYTDSTGFEENDGIYQWIVPDTPCIDAVVRITAIDEFGNSTNDESDNTFSYYDGAQISITPSSLSFDINLENSTEETQTLTIANSGDVPLVIGVNFYPVVDIDGNVYETVQIGDQLWMKENLKVTHYNNGDEIQYVQSESSEPNVWANLSTGAYGYYNDDLSHQETYGNLYNWYAVETGNLAPEGWHVATDEEWTVLEDFITNDGYAGIEGNALKEIGYEHWEGSGNSDDAGIDIYAFTGLPGGYRGHDGGNYNLMGLDGDFWSSTEYSSLSAWLRELYYDNSGIFRYDYDKRIGFSVRCVRDIDYWTIRLSDEPNNEAHRDSDFRDEWLTVNPFALIIPPDSTADVLVTVYAGGMDYGAHAGTIIFYSNDPVNDEVEVLVSMTITETVHSEFTADQTSGIDTLTVQFSSQPTGDYNSFLWDFGDGATSTEQNTVHTYTHDDNIREMSFSVSLTVSGDGGTDTEIKENYITVFSPPQISIFPSSLSFDINLENGAEETQTLTITNSGDVPLEIEDVTMNHGFNSFLLFDIDGNVYETVQIGNQVWMAENLKVAHYNNGDEIPTGYSNSEWTNLSTGAYAVYDNNESNADTFGYLYNWYAVEMGNLAPEGWHVPTDEEIKQLEMYLGMSQEEADDTGYRGTNEGSKLAGRADLWWNGDLENDPEFGTSGFNFLPGGARSKVSGNFINMGDEGDFWTSEESWFRELEHGNTLIQREIYDYRSGFSVRCVKESWLTLSETMLIIPPDSSAEVQVTVSAEGLDYGTHADTIIFYSNDPVNGELEVPVSMTVTETVHSEFTADQTSGIDTLTVQFSSQPTGDYNSFLWDFGDGATSTEQNTVHTYTYDDNIREMSFTVSLTVSGDGGTDTEMKEDYITLFAPAQISITPSSLSFDINLENSTEETQTLTITNSGDVPLEVAINQYFPVVDIDGNVYQNVQIGEQLWMAENLKVTHYNDGSEIPTGYSNSEWTDLDETETGAYAVYDDNPVNAETYGNLYNWYAVDDSRGICPEDWHVPSDGEYSELSDYLGGQSVAGGKMKECTPGSCPESEYWNSPNTGATNESGLTGLPGGYRTYGGSYGYMGLGGYFWSSTELSSDYAWNRVLYYNYSEIYRIYGSKGYGFSVRCIRDLDYLTILNSDEPNNEAHLDSDFRDDWLTLSETMLTIPPDSSADVQVTVNAGGLDYGAYADTIIFYSNDPVNDEVEVPVSMTVTETVHSEFTADQTSGIDTLTVQFTDLSTGDYDSFLWDFGDGATSTEQNPVHTYTHDENTREMSFTVSLTASGDGGTDTEVKENFITVYNPVFVDFSADTLAGIDTLEVNFTSTTEGDHDSFLWEFGDGATSTDENPTHVYTVEPGITEHYTVSLTVSGDGGTITETKENYILMYSLADFSLIRPTSFTEDMVVFPFLEWESSFVEEEGEEKYYEVWISKSPVFTEDETVIYQNTDTYLYPEVDLVVGTTYFWKVSANQYDHQVWAEMGGYAYWMFTTVDHTEQLHPMIDGEIADHRTLIPENSPYYSSQNPFTAYGKNLTVQPGVEIQFSESTELLIGGNLYINGTEGDSIYFTGYDEQAEWDGIRFSDNDFPRDTLFVNEDHSYISGNIIEYANFGQCTKVLETDVDMFITNSHFQEFATGVNIGDGSYILNSVFENSTGDTNDGYAVYNGIYFENNSINNIQGYGISANAEASFINNTIQNCTSYGINGGSLFENNTISDNGSYGIICDAQAVLTENIIHNNNGNGVTGGITFTNNEVTENSGYGIYGGSLLDSNTVSNNGSYAINCNTNAILSNNTIENNSGYAIADGQVITGNTIKFNQSGSSSLITSSSVIQFSDNIVENNQSNKLLYFTNLDSLDMYANILDTNQTRSNLIEITGNSLEITNNVIDENANVPGYNGGSAIYISDQDGQSRIEENQITYHNGYQDGGGIYVYNGVGLQINGNAISYNEVIDQGGGIYVYNGNVSIVNNTLTNNTSNYASAVYISNGNIEIQENIITYNTGEYAIWGSPEIFTQNNIFYNFHESGNTLNLRYTGSSDVDYDHNFWGTRSDQGDIDPSIYDDNESGGEMGMVNYQPILTGPSPLTPGQLSVIDSVLATEDAESLEPDTNGAEIGDTVYVCVVGEDGNPFSQDLTEVSIINLTTYLPLQPLMWETSENTGIYRNEISISSTIYNPPQNIMLANIGDTLMISSTVDPEKVFYLPIVGSGIDVIVDYQSGWNLVGLPLEVEDASYSNLFPESIEGTLYSFNGGYITESYLTSGEGYWLRFENSGSTTINGTPINELTISLSEGWNLVSGLSDNVSIYSVIDPDSVIVPGTLYGFNGGYIETDMLVPGNGYWVRAFEAGEITLTSGALAKTSPRDFSLKGKANSLTINDTELYFGIELSDRERLSYSLPPKPPVGAFDVRFKGDTRIAGENIEIEVMSPYETITISYDVILDAGEHMNWVITSKGGSEYTLEGTGEITVSTEDTFTLERKAIIPIAYTLHQNYPNPFNPITSLRYDLPAQEQVILTIYDLMGREVTQLVNTTQDAGFKSVQWNATDMHGKPVSAGVYLYQIRAGEFVQTKKMVLLK